MPSRFNTVTLNSRAKVKYQTQKSETSETKLMMGEDTSVGALRVPRAASPDRSFRSVSNFVWFDRKRRRNEAYEFDSNCEAP